MLTSASGDGGLTEAATRNNSARSSSLLFCRDQHLKMALFFLFKSSLFNISCLGLGTHRTTALNRKLDVFDYLVLTAGSLRRKTEIWRRKRYVIKCFCCYSSEELSAPRISPFSMKGEVFVLWDPWALADHHSQKHY